MQESADETRAQLQARCGALIEHVKLLRDYATTPGDVWLARGELNQIQETMAEVEELLAKLKKLEKSRD